MHSFWQNEQCLFWSHQNEIVQLEPWGRDSIRVRVTVNTTMRDDLFSVLLSPVKTESVLTIDEKGATLRNGILMARVSPQGRISFFETTSGKELLAEVLEERATRQHARSFDAGHSDQFHLETRFCAYEDERLYGLGQHQHGQLNQKGCVIDLIQRNTEVAIPFLFSSRGYGFLWHNPAVGRVELGKTATRWVAEATPQLDYWITAGSTPAEIMEHYADATGYPSEFPAWAAGFWQSKLRYRTQEELLEVVHEYQRRNLPLAAIVIDYFHWTLQGDWRFDPESWPDPSAMVRELEEAGVQPVVSIWPTVNPLSENFPQLQQRGLLVRADQGVSTLLTFFDHRPEGPTSLYFYDATNSDARQFLWEQVQEHYVQHGITAWWLDCCEPEMYPLQPDNLRFALGTGSAVANAYPFLHERGFYENQRASGETDALLNLCRSGWAGSQRYGVAIWSGDVNSTFETLQKQVRVGLNMSLSGIPWWTTDIGGFYGGNIESPIFQELLVRWFQYSTFCPLTRLHGYRLPEDDHSSQTHSGGPNEPWSFGEEVYGILKTFLFLRESMRPYILKQMRVAQETGTPPMRPLFFDFWQDEQCAHIDDQFLFGPDLLIAPILQEGARSREVYLPAGETWIDVWSDQQLEGGQCIVADAPLERIPLYKRENAPLPFSLKHNG